MTGRLLKSVIPAFMALLILAGACVAETPESPGEAPGDELMVCCCFGEYTVAEEFSRRIQEASPGSAVRIGARKVEDDSKRLVFEVYASHPDLTPEQLAEKLAGFSCPNAR